MLVREATHKILAATHVLIDDTKNFHNNLRTVPALQAKDFHFSNVIEALPGAWIYPKQLNSTLKETLTLNLQWLVDFGIYDAYWRAISNRLFNHIYQAKETINDGMTKCRGSPKDKRDLLAQRIRPPTDVDVTVAYTIKHPKLSMAHLKYVFVVLVVGYVAAAFAAFMFELLWDRGARQTQTTIEFRARRTSRLEVAKAGIIKVLYIFIQ
jgi:hypothetical protein